MSPLSEEERAQAIARARADLERAWAEERARRAAGEPPPVISSTKWRFRPGADMFYRPTATGIEGYFPEVWDDASAIPSLPGDWDEYGNPTEQGYDRRRFLAAKAQWLFAGSSGPAPEWPLDATDVVLGGDGVVITYPDGTRLWRDRQWRLHRTDGPAVERPDAQQWWVEGVRTDDPGGGRAPWEHGPAPRGDAPRRQR